MGAAPVSSSALGREPDTSQGSSQVPLSLDEHRILIVDRDPHSAKLLLRQLASTDNWGNAAMKVVSHGLEALIVAEQFRPNLVIIETSWPRRSGASTAKHLRARQWAGNCVIVSHSRLSEGAHEHQPTFDIDFHFFQNLSVGVLARITPHLAQRRAFDLAKAGAPHAWHVHPAQRPKTGKNARPTNV